MKGVILFVCFLSAFLISVAQEKKPETVNAKFIFFQGEDTVDMKNPVIRLTRTLYFTIRARQTFKAVAYKVTAGGSEEKPYESSKLVTADGGIDFRGFLYSTRKGDKLSLEIPEMTDETGAKFRSAKTTYNFTFDW